VVVELSAILCFFTKFKLQNIAGTNAADTWWQKLAADFPSFSKKVYKRSLYQQIKECCIFKTSQLI
jgi:hypothetical protein